MTHDALSIAPLEEEELNFILKKFQKEQHSFWRVLRGLVVLGLLIPLLTLFLLKSMPDEVVWKRELREKQFPDYYFLIVAGVLLLIILIGSYYSYWSTIRKIALDVKYRRKIIERTIILRKVYMPQNKAFYFYINSDKKLSIEVNADDYSFYQEGDEINIEYSQYAGEYLGYF